VARLGRRRREHEASLAGLKAAQFRVAVEERLRALETEVADVKGRVNGLIFVVLGAVITQVLLNLLK